MSYAKYFPQFKKNTTEDLTSLLFYFSLLEEDATGEHWGGIDRAFQSLETSSQLLRWEAFSEFWKDFKQFTHSWRDMSVLSPPLGKKVREALGFLNQVIEGLQEDSPLWKKEERARDLFREIFVLLESKSDSPSATSLVQGISPEPSSPFSLSLLAKKLAHLSLCWEEYKNSPSPFSTGKNMDGTLKELQSYVEIFLLEDLWIEVLLLEGEEQTLWAIEMEWVEKIGVWEDGNFPSLNKVLNKPLGSVGHDPRPDHTLFLKLPEGEITCSFQGQILGREKIYLQPLSPHFSPSPFKGGAILPHGKMAFVLNPQFLSTLCRNQ